MLVLSYLLVVQADGRLFAIGEDAGLAALRSAGKALAEAGKRRRVADLGS